VLEADVAPDDVVRSPELREVLNYVDVAEDAMAWVRDGRPITVGMLSDMQRRLFHGTPSETAETGRLRLIQVVVGAKDLPVEQARFVPPPPGTALESALQDWRDWIEDADIPLPPVVRAALGHYQFECLHPYTDGNGRLGRLIIVLQLMRAGVIDEGLLAVSPWFEARRREYQDQLFRVSCTGDFDEWVKFFCAGVKVRADATASAVVALVQYQAELRQLAIAEKLSGTILHVLDDLIGRPVQTARSLANTHTVTPQTAYNIIRKLMELDVLVELTGRTYGKVFAAARVLAIVRR
jgi:Fic family protein